MTPAAATAATAFPLIAPQLATLGADSPLAGQQVLCVPDSAFAEGGENQWGRVGRFAITPPVTRRQFAEFVRRSEGKIFLVNMQTLWVGAFSRQQGETDVEGEASFADVAQKVVERWSDWNKPRVTNEEVKRDVRELLGATDSHFSQLAEVLLQSVFRLFQIPPFSYPDDEGENPVRVPFVNAVAYANFVGGRLPLPDQIGYAQRAAQRDSSKDRSQWTSLSEGDGKSTGAATEFSVVLEDDPLQLLGLFPFTWQVGALPPGTIDFVLRGLAGVLERETGIIHVFPDKDSALKDFPNRADFEEEGPYAWKDWYVRRHHR